MKPLEASIAGEPLLLDERRAIYWPRQRWLLVADVHLGKASLLRQAGASLPRGTTTRDLDRLSALVDSHAPVRLVVLGDLIHGSERLDAAWLASFDRWRGEHAALELVLVAGNHDRHMALGRFGFHVIEECEAAPLVLRHAPDPHPTLHVVAGHVHPGVRVRDGRVRHRFPAFWLGPKRTVLPAFGSLCGLSPNDAPSEDRVYAATPGGVLALGPR